MFVAFSFIAMVVALVGECTPIAAQTSGPASTTSPPAVNDSEAQPPGMQPIDRDHDFCPVRPTLIAADESATRYVITLSSIESGVASGMLALFAGDARYDVPFARLQSPGVDSSDIKATPLVVRFPDATYLDGAYVSALSGAGGGACRVPYMPWRKSTGGQAADQATRLKYHPFFERMQKVVPIDAPAPVADPPACREPDRTARRTHAARVQNPLGLEHAILEATLLVLVDDHDAVVGMRFLHSTGFPSADAEVRWAAARSTYEGATFRCMHIVAPYRLNVTFHG